MPLYRDRNGQVRVILTKRPDHMRTHPGDVVFPGGRLEEGESPEQTAKREACEEIGLPEGGVVVVGGLTPLTTRDPGNLIVPVVAKVQRPADFVLQEEEVEAVIEPTVLEQNFQVNTMALLHLSRLAAPAMIEAGHGVILCTGNTSTYRGKALFAGFAPTKAAQRILAESMARSLGPQGVHVAYLAIDAVIDVPWTRRAYPDKPDAYFCQPDDIAGECWHIAHQSPSAWTFDVMIRPAGETW